MSSLVQEGICRRRSSDLVLDGGPHLASASRGFGGVFSGTVDVLFQTLVTDNSYPMASVSIVAGPIQLVITASELADYVHFLDGTSGCTCAGQPRPRSTNTPRRPRLSRSLSSLSRSTDECATHARRPQPAPRSGSTPLPMTQHAANASMLPLAVRATERLAPRNGSRSRARGGEILAVRFGCLGIHSPDEPASGRKTGRSSKPAKSKVQPIRLLRAARTSGCRPQHLICKPTIPHFKSGGTSKNHSIESQFKSVIVEHHCSI